MPYVHRSYRVPVDLDERMRRRRDETGVPLNLFLCRLIESALDEEERRKEPKRRRRVAG